MKKLASLKQKKWNIQPSGYTLGEFVGVLTPNNYLAGFFIHGSTAKTFELQNVRSYPQDATVHLNGKWEGTSQLNGKDNQSASITFNNST